MRGLWLLLIWVPFFVPALLRFRCTIRTTPSGLTVIGMVGAHVVPRGDIAGFYVAERSTFRIQELCVWVMLRDVQRSVPLRITSAAVLRAGGTLEEVIVEASERAPDSSDERPAG